MDELFAPPADTWQRLSPKYATLERLTTVIGVVVVFGAAALIVGAASAVWWISAVIIAVALVIIIARWIVIGRALRSWGYLERDEDLFITHGVLFRTLVAVPYGRMQLVEVNSGPLQRAFGLATVQLVTASASTDATIPGLPPDEAARLRDRLTERGETHTAGI
ncbi:hypothetical protein FHX74_001051 [Friedmanniella endophytica]|uniref:YdbS-like PH domain-containing protein n=1 Tax=Microlunatus kandeliicorticis TaxID=1759536 RepID=A0A7W3IQM0_9ACTN|nr:PH domain-containing protein [Microlunatus kandeliicorticis]MBA8793446.1 hypothetical protein [Microlunatus kandeliicorticis]